MTKHNSASKAASKSTSKITAKPTMKSAAKSKLAKSNFKSASSSASSNFRESDTKAPTSINPTISPITLEQNGTKPKASTVSAATVIDTNASILVDSTATASATESVVFDTSINASITNEVKVTDPAVDAPSAVEATFELFPKLPAELRIEIWKLVPAPRIVVVHFHIDGRKRAYKFGASLPVILHACQESRYEALKIYHRAFDSKWALNGTDFNFKVDTLVLHHAGANRRELFLRNLKPNDLSRIERIALNRVELGTVPRLVGLKEVIYTVHSSFYHTHISSCSTRDGSIHTPEELLEFNPDEPGLRSHLKRTQLKFSKFKERFEESEEVSKISIRLGYLCMRGMPKEGNSFYFK